MSQSNRYGRVMTVEEYKALPSLTEEERAHDIAAVQTILEDVRKQHEAFLAAGGHVMTDDEWQEWWDHQNDHDDDWSDLETGSPK